MDLYIIGKCSKAHATANSGACVGVAHELGSVRVQT